MNITGIFYGVDWEFVYGSTAIILIIFFIFLLVITRLKEKYVKAEQIVVETKNKVSTKSVVVLEKKEKEISIPDAVSIAEELRKKHIRGN